MQYFMSHPDVGVTALVEAPSAEKARTTYLDYLERSGNIYRAQRQLLRRNMITQKVRDPEAVTADVTLSYGYQQAAVEPEPPLTYEEDPLGENIEVGQQGRELPIQGVPERTSRTREDEIWDKIKIPEQPTPQRKLSRIAQVALGGNR